LLDKGGKGSYAEPMTEGDKQAQLKRLRYWQEAAERDKETAESLLQLKRYDWSLFIYHLALEKLLKALVIKAEKIPPPIHQLNRLAELVNLEVPEKYRDWLAEITDYNIEARYDDEKLSFYHKATVEYATLWQEKCNELFLWLEKKLR
jgi:HEPN domain-containing protein